MDYNKLDFLTKQLPTADVTLATNNIEIVFKEALKEINASRYEIVVMQTDVTATKFATYTGATFENKLSGGTAFEPITGYISAKFAASSKNACYIFRPDIQGGDDKVILEFSATPTLTDYTVFVNFHNVRNTFKEHTKV